MSKFAINVKFTTHEGKRDELKDILVQAATSLNSVPECELYIVHLSDSELNAVYVNEIWSDAEAHQASLTLEETKQMIQRAMPLIAGVEQVKLVPVGGKGIR